MIRILLIDDHSLFRESLGRLLESEPDFAVAGMCSSPYEGVRLLNESPVDLVLLDFDLGEQQGTAFLEMARAAGYTGKILLVTAGMSDGDIAYAKENGASGLFLKHLPPGQLVAAIHLTMSQANSPVGPAETPPAPQQERLTPRERSVLKGIFEGLMNKEIAARLGISESSVKAAIQQLFVKTGVRTRSQLVRIALERNLGN